MEQIQQQLDGRNVRNSVAQKFAYFYWLVYAYVFFLLTFFTWLRDKNKPICWCTNWNSPFILGDISLLKIAKFLYSLGIEAPKKRVLYHVFTAGLGMLLLCMQNEIHAQRVQVRAPFCIYTLHLRKSSQLWLMVATSKM